MNDRFAGMSADLHSPYVGGAAVVPSDDTEISATRALWVGGEGDLAVTYMDGSTDTLQSIPAGTMLRIRVIKVMEASTASKISALY